MTNEQGKEWKTWDPQGHQHLCEKSFNKPQYGNTSFSLYTSHWILVGRICLKIKITLLIIYFILLTYIFYQVVILEGKITCLSQLEFKGLKAQATRLSNQCLMLTSEIFEPWRQMKRVLLKLYWVLQDKIFLESHQNWRVLGKYYHKCLFSLKLKLLQISSTVAICWLETSYHVRNLAAYRVFEQNAK